MKILVLNSGSSSLKSSLYDLGAPLPQVAPDPLWQGEIEWSANDAEIKIETSGGTKSKQKLKVASREEATRQLLATLWTGTTRVLASAKEIEVVGHRVVNGGPNHREPAIIDAKVKAAIEAAVAFAPLHNQAELDGIAVAEKVIPGVPQVAVFDTGFHRTLPAAAYVYPGPYEWLAKGIRRYGFHGINHRYIAERAPQILQRDSRGLRIVSCHLGNGCSLAAIRDGLSVDTTMGFTPLEGLMMGTRSGSVDPGILTYLMRQEKQTGEQLDDLLNKKSGLLGIAGFSGDMREIIEEMKNAGANAPAQDSAPPIDAGDKSARAKLAFDMFVHRLRREIGGMIAVLGGLDVLVFTAGIGENSADVRAAACGPFAFAGVHLDAAKNARSPVDADISATSSTVRVLIIAAQEDWMIARDCFGLTT
ncbi:MAG TPA: acetate kinase [Candidatus Acidoferrales bacterium]